LSPVVPCNASRWCSEGLLVPAWPRVIEAEPRRLFGPRPRPRVFLRALASVPPVTSLAKGVSVPGVVSEATPFPPSSSPATTKELCSAPSDWAARRALGLEGQLLCLRLSTGSRTQDGCAWPWWTALVAISGSDCRWIGSKRFMLRANQGNSEPASRSRKRWPDLKV
jgi:hypothetical protein